MPIAVAAIGGAAWLIGGVGLLGPLLSLLLPLATTLSRSRRQAWVAAWVYYLIGTVSITGAITGYYGTGHAWLGLLAWIGSSAVLALPWLFGRSAVGRLFATVATALPPLGVIGWLSPLNAAGVLFPMTWWAGLVFTLLLIARLDWIRDLPDHFAKIPMVRLGVGTALIATMVLANGLTLLIHGWHGAPAPAGWIGLQTRIPPARGNLVQEIANRQALIDAAREQGQHADVLVFPEAMLDDWWGGTRRQLAAAIPPGQTWIIGAQAHPTQQPGANTASGKRINAVVSARQNQAEPVVLTAASGLLLGGDWTPWNNQGMQPAQQRRAFNVGGQQAWASLCVEQLQPWTWLLVMSGQPDLILAMSNGWWAPEGSYATRIQVASAKSWARLINTPVIWAVNAPAIR